MSQNGLAPRWASAPGETITAVMSEKQLDFERTSARLNLTSRGMEDLLHGRTAITPQLAASLSAAIGASQQFWLARENQYREDLVRVAADRWTQEFPLRQMAELGWIESTSDWHAQIDQCLDFFGVDSPDEWKERYEDKFQSAHYRRSPTFSINGAATTAWFRACEKRADEIGNVERYNANRFEESLSEIRRLTRQKDPKIFAPRLSEICAGAGVAVVVVRAPSGCPASGAARIYRDNPLIQLTARHLTDDHFWFSFFHEAAHVLQHNLDEVFLDLEDDDTGSPTEIAADLFANSTLIPNPIPPLPKKLTTRDAVRIAVENQVSPGIIVGHLQHLGAVSQNSLNRLKRRYRWNDSNLEMK
ncbi:ImmA/IrrE family metallo-endopeptidase [Rhodococcoides yunnanense]|uniref:ImmA/IrrE family metallo-endopeptidase n=1 Tax=Rhodococcoides yunnanense TaxID=278209 RepID=A0ABU4BI56_9NOCA|nr:ImmA/IrrE family metallo-endopeptidase [Rhodococcus yunnanensis]MDV6263892.1 ImmA/IrrE family metallo-endopeptidase [Rhodococcus yunnanensis]